jgi:UDP-N-acetylmuramate dehydrogenase
LTFAESKNLSVQILGGGSNLIFPDDGFNGLIVKIDLKGVRFEEQDDCTEAYARAGEVWDDFVKLCIDKNVSGIECLSGIPGLVGATPIQNVGAYGQEVKETIIRVSAIDRKSLELVQFSSRECSFGYRKSRFKGNDEDKFVIVEVCYRLKKSGKPSVRYEELRDYLESRKSKNGNLKTQSGEANLQEVRGAVLALRKKKSMVIDPADPNARSVGSFFVNPVLSEGEYDELTDTLRLRGIEGPPSFKSIEGVKIPAAWLVENSGFHKGYKRNGVGISSNHALALVNYSGTAKELLSLASEIEKAVFEKFEIRLEREAAVIESQ